LVGGTVAGAAVTVYANGTAIGSAVASGASTTVTTDGTFDLPDGARSITARQTELGKTESANSAAVTIYVDTAAPTCSMANLKDASDTGVSNTDNITQAIAPQFDGTASDPTSNGYASGIWQVVVSSDDGRVGIDSASPFYDAALATLGEGSRTVSAAVYDVAGNSYVNPTALGLVVDRTAPTVASTVVNLGAAQRSVIRLLDFTFSEDVSIGKSALTLQDYSTGGQANLAAATFSYDSGARRARWGLTNVPLNNAYFDARIQAALATDAAGNYLGGGSDYVYRFLHLPGDANGDGGVNVGDLGILGEYYAMSGNWWELPADMNADGWVNVGDLGILGENYNASLTPPGGGTGIPMALASVAPSVEIATGQTSQQEPSATTGIDPGIGGQAAIPMAGPGRAEADPATETNEPTCLALQPVLAGPILHPLEISSTRSTTTTVAAEWAGKDSIQDETVDVLKLPALASLSA
jgi:hypothetical protein